MRLDVVLYHSFRSPIVPYVRLHIDRLTYQILRLTYVFYSMPANICRIALTANILTA